MSRHYVGVYINRKWYRLLLEYNLSVEVGHFLEQYYQYQEQPLLEVELLRLRRNLVKNIQWTKLTTVHWRMKRGLWIEFRSKHDIFSINQCSDKIINLAFSVSNYLRFESTWSGSGVSIPAPRNNKSTAVGIDVAVCGHRGESSLLLLFINIY